jgi:hypothetical protein
MRGPDVRREGMGESMGVQSRNNAAGAGGRAGAHGIGFSAYDSTGAFYSWFAQGLSASLWLSGVMQTVDWLLICRA